MPNEIPDEFATWRSRLRQPDALPEQGLDDKEAAWDKLFLRLNEKPGRRFYGYRIAAACLLICLIPATQLFHGRRDGGAMRRGVPQPAAPVVSAAPPAGQPVELLRPANPKPVNYQAVTRRTRPRPKPITTPVRAETAPAPAQSPALALTLPPPQTAIPQLPISRPPKKQWKVTDLSELSPGRQMPHGVTANTRDEDDPRLKIHLNTQQNR